MKQFFPIYESLKNYSWHTFVKDLSAGLSISPVVISQGISYAVLAGVPPVFGLNTFIYPVMIYFIFGSGRHTCNHNLISVVGPFALTSLMVGQAVKSINGPNATSAVNVDSVLNLTLLCGLFHCCLGLLQIGPYLSLYLLPNSLVSSFTFGSAFQVN